MESRKVWLGSFLLAGFVLGWLGIRDFKSSKPGDFYQFWLVGQAISTLDIENVYLEPDTSFIRKTFLEKGKISNSKLLKRSQRPWKRKLQLTATPLLYSIYTLASTDNFYLSYQRIRIASYLIFLGSFLLLCFRLRIPVILILIIFYFLTYKSGTFLKNVWFANVGELQAASIMIFACMGEMPKSRWFYVAKGFLLFLIVAFKPTLIFVPLLLLISQFLSERAALVKYLVFGFFLGALFSITLPFVLFGTKCTWWGWLEGYKIFGAELQFRRSFFGLLFGGFDPVRRSVLTGLLVLLPIGILAIHYYKNDIRPNFFTDFKGPVLDPINLNIISISIAIFLLVGHIVHIHYFVVATPIILICWRFQTPKIENQIWVFCRRILSTCAVFMVIAPRHDRSEFFLWSFYGVLLLYLVSIIDLWLGFYNSRKEINFNNWSVFNTKFIKRFYPF